MCILFLCFNSWADEKTEQGSVLYKNGQDLFEEGKYTEALMAWEEAYAITENKVMLKHIARAQEAQGDFKSAIETIYKYRAFAPHNEQEALKEWLSNLEKLQHQGEIEARARQEQEIAKQEQEQEIAKQEQEQEIAKKEERAQEQEIAKKEAISQEAYTPSKIPMYLTWGGTAALGTVGIIFTKLAVDSQQEILLYCHEETEYCLSNLPPDSVNDFKTQRLISIISWSATAVGIGTSSWLTSKQLSIRVEPNAISIQGEF